jgi:flagellar M-ring protein FliF
VLVRERESARDSATPDARNSDARTARGSSMQRDAEYQAGRRVEHVVTHPGAIRRLQVVTIVRQELDAARIADVQRFVSAAVGALPERGDTVVVQTVQAASTKTPDSAARPPVLAPQGAENLTPLPVTVGQATGLLVIVFVTIVWLARGKLARGPRRLTQRQRELALQRVQAWLQSASPGDVQSRRVTAGGQE